MKATAMVAETEPMYRADGNKTNLATDTLPVINRDQGQPTNMVTFLEETN